MNRITDMKSYIKDVTAAARKASLVLMTASTDLKNRALLTMAETIQKRRDALVEANGKDLDAARKSGLAAPLVSRLELSKRAFDGMVRGLREVAGLADPTGVVLEEWTPPAGVHIRKVSQPIGVILVIYESRPNVTVDSAGLCLKSGNACILRGGSESIHSNRALAECLKDALRSVGLPPASVQVIQTTDRAAVGELLQAREEIDLVVPRGGKELIRRVVTESLIPVIKHYEGICHTYVDVDADLGMAQEVCFNAKVQRPDVCNAMETLLVHRDVAERFLPGMLERFRKAGVELRGCPRVCAMDAAVKPASEEDWHTEYLDLILSVKIVDNIDEAILHVNRYGSRHSDAIVTGNPVAARRFTEGVDTAAVFVNCSTRLHDGGQFGMGAEIGISTDKIHARGPMGLRELTTYKYVVEGQGQIRS